MCTYTTETARMNGSAKGPGARVALELTAASARDLVTAIEAALAAVPEDMLT